MSMFQNDDFYPAAEQNDMILMDAELHPSNQFGAEESLSQSLAALIND